MNELNEEKLELFKKWINESRRIVFFGGAGVSTESGIPDFRSVDGLYNQKYDVPPETILSADYFAEHTEEFYRFYRDKMLYTSAEPNVTHYKLAELEKAGKLTAVVTQNIDGLHYKAGSRNVHELHGTIERYTCLKCAASCGLEDILKTDGVPHCKCGGVLKPDVVLYGEPLDSKVIDAAIRDISQSDMLIIGGTSLTVYPAAGFIRFYKGHKLVLINKSHTPFDREADLVFNCGLGSVFSQIEL